MGRGKKLGFGACGCKSSPGLDDWYAVLGSAQTL
jgi:hypothetical protein